MKLDSPNVKPFPKWHTDNLSVYAAGQTAIEKGETEFDYVHHIDENKLNATKSNLAIIPCREHQRYHNKGKQISNYQRQRIIETNRLRKGTRRDYYKSDVSAHDVYILVKQGYSFNKISKLLGLDWSCVKQRYFDYIYDNPELLEVAE